MRETEWPSLCPRLPAGVHDVLQRARGLPADVDVRLDWVVEAGLAAPLIGCGDTVGLWSLLAASAGLDVALARMLEPHLDALAILDQAGRGPTSDEIADVGATSASSWGVFAAEGSGHRLEAREGARGWRLTGSKPWCSLAGHLSHALVTATAGETRRLFAVDLRAGGVSPRTGPWLARGLTEVVSAPIDFADAPAVPVGGPRWYLERPGFAWGGMSVAAVWWGAATGLLPALAGAAAAERADQVALVHLGRADSALWAARSVLRDAAACVDGRDPGDPGLLGARVRNAVADAASVALAEADAALGPAPLVADERHAKRVADLHLYLRQHHGLRDAARAGRLALASGGFS